MNFILAQIFAFFHLCAYYLVFGKIETYIYRTIRKNEWKYLWFNIYKLIIYFNLC